MKPANAPELLAQPDIDGGLIGGAVSRRAEFLQIIAAAFLKRKTQLHLNRELDSLMNVFITIILLRFK